MSLHLLLYIALHVSYYLMFINMMMSLLWISATRSFQGAREAGVVGLIAHLAVGRTEAVGHDPSALEARRAAAVEHRWHLAQRDLAGDAAAVGLALAPGKRWDGDLDLDLQICSGVSSRKYIYIEFGVFIVDIVYSMYMQKSCIYIYIIVSVYHALLSLLKTCFQCKCHLRRHTSTRCAGHVQSGPFSLLPMASPRPLQSSKGLKKPPKQMPRDDLRVAGAGHELHDLRPVPSNSTS